MKVSMKRFLVLIAMLCMALFSVMLVTACDNGGTEKQHQHRWDEGAILTGDEPTCTESGKKTYHCLAEGCPQQIKTEVVPKLGHAFATRYTVDKEATLTEDGWESQHCNRCSETRNGRVIPKTSESGIMYRIKVNRWNGTKLKGAPRVTFYNEDGERAHEAEYYPLNLVETGHDSTEYYMLEVSLPLREYQVALSNIPDGFEYEKFYTISGENGTAPYDTPETYPELDIRLESHLIKGELPAKLERGDVFPDFEIKSLNRGTVTLSDLLEEYDLVLLHFYYNDCQYCRSEAPFFMQVYEEYKDRIAVVCFNTSKDDNILGTYKSIFNYSDDFYFLRDATGAWQTRVLDGAGVPSTVVIDKGGCFVVKLGTVQNTDYILRVIQANLPERVEEKPNAPVSLNEVDVILPEKKSYVL